jgi:ribose transport system permease protein
VLVTAQVGAADASSGPAYLLPAYAAAFLGATAIRPGFFNVWGTLIAIFLVAIGITGLQLKGAEPWVTPVFNGGVLLLAVAVSNFAATQRVLVRARSAVPRRRRAPTPAPPPPESA